MKVGVGLPVQVPFVAVTGLPTVGPAGTVGATVLAGTLKSVASAEVAFADPAGLVAVTRTASDGWAAARSVAVSVYVCAIAGAGEVMSTPLRSH